MRKLGYLAGAALLCGGLATTTAEAAPITAVANPGGTTSEIGTRLRWGATGFEASIFDSDPFGQTPTLNPGGTPIWQVGLGYGFQVTFAGTTGTLGLSVDFNRDNSFGAGETISRSVFGGATTDYTGLAFAYLSISGNEGGSTARSTLSDLVINGTALPGLAPNGGFVEQFYQGAGPLADITVTGTLTFTTAGTAQERPSWNVTLRDAGPVPVPEPATRALFGMGLLGLGMAMRRRA
jgi:hypothetical protein